MFQHKLKTGQATPVTTPEMTPPVDATTIPVVLPEKEFVLEWNLVNIKDKARIDAHFRDLEKTVTLTPLRAPSFTIRSTNVRS